MIWKRMCQFTRDPERAMVIGVRIVSWHRWLPVCGLPARISPEWGTAQVYEIGYRGPTNSTVWTVFGTMVAVRWRP